MPIQLKEVAESWSSDWSVHAEILENINNYNYADWLLLHNHSKTGNLFSVIKGVNFFLQSDDQTVSAVIQNYQENPLLAQGYIDLMLNVGRVLCSTTFSEKRNLHEKYVAKARVLLPSIGVLCDDLAATALLNSCLTLFNLPILGEKLIGSFTPEQTGILLSSLKRMQKEIVGVSSENDIYLLVDRAALVIELNYSDEERAVSESRIHMAHVDAGMQMLTVMEITNPLKALTCLVSYCNQIGASRVFSCRSAREEYLSRHIAHISKLWHLYESEIFYKDHHNLLSDIIVLYVTINRVAPALVDSVESLLTQFTSQIILSELSQYHRDDRDDRDDRDCFYVIDDFSQIYSKIIIQFRGAGLVNPYFETEVLPQVTAELVGHAAGEPQSMQFLSDLVLLWTRSIKYHSPTTVADFAGLINLHSNHDLLDSKKSYYKTFERMWVSYVLAEADSAVSVLQMIKSFLNLTGRTFVNSNVVGLYDLFVKILQIIDFHTVRAVNLPPDHRVHLDEIKMIVDESKEVLAGCFSEKFKRQDHTPKALIEMSFILSEMEKIIFEKRADDFIVKSSCLEVYNKMYQKLTFQYVRLCHSFLDKLGNEVPEDPVQFYQALKFTWVTLFQVAHISKNDNPDFKETMRLIANIVSRSMQILACIAAKSKEKNLAVQQLIQANETLCCWLYRNRMIFMKNICDVVEKFCSQTDGTEIPPCLVLYVMRNIEYKGLFQDDFKTGQDLEKLCQQQVTEWSRQLERKNDYSRKNLQYITQVIGHFMMYRLSEYDQLLNVVIKLMGDYKPDLLVDMSKISPDSVTIIKHLGLLVYGYDMFGETQYRGIVADYINDIWLCILGILKQPEGVKRLSKMMKGNDSSNWLLSNAMLTSVCSIESPYMEDMFKYLCNIVDIIDIFDKDGLLHYEKSLELLLQIKIRNEELEIINQYSRKMVALLNSDKVWSYLRRDMDRHVKHGYFNYLFLTIGHIKRMGLGDVIPGVEEKLHREYLSYSSYNVVCLTYTLSEQLAPLSGFPESLANIYKIIDISHGWYKKALSEIGLRYLEAIKTLEDVKSILNKLFMPALPPEGGWVQLLGKTFKSQLRMEAVEGDVRCISFDVVERWLKNEGNLVPSDDLNQTCFAVRIMQDVSQYDHYRNTLRIISSMKDGFFLGMIANSEHPWVKKYNEILTVVKDQFQEQEQSLAGKKLPGECLRPEKLGQVNKLFRHFSENEELEPDSSSMSLWGMFVDLESYLLGNESSIIPSCQEKVNQMAMVLATHPASGRIDALLALKKYPMQTETIPFSLDTNPLWYFIWHEIMAPESDEHLSAYERTEELISQAKVPMSESGVKAREELRIIEQEAIDFRSHQPSGYLMALAMSVGEKWTFHHTDKSMGNMFDVARQPVDKYIKCKQLSHVLLCALNKSKSDCTQDATAFYGKIASRFIVYFEEQDGWSRFNILNQFSSYPLFDRQVIQGLRQAAIDSFLQKKFPNQLLASCQFVARNGYTLEFSVGGSQYRFNASKDPEKTRRMIKEKIKEHGENHICLLSPFMKAYRAYVNHLDHLGFSAPEQLTQAILKNWSDIERCDYLKVMGELTNHIAEKRLWPLFEALNKKYGNTWIRDITDQLQEADGSLMCRKYFGLLAMREQHQWAWSSLPSIRVLLGDSDFMCVDGNLHLIGHDIDISSGTPEQVMRELNILKSEGGVEKLQAYQRMPKDWRAFIEEFMLLSSEAIDVFIVKLTSFIDVGEKVSLVGGYALKYQHIFEPAPKHWCYRVTCSQEELEKKMSAEWPTKVSCSLTKSYRDLLTGLDHCIYKLSDVKSEVILDIACETGVHPTYELEVARWDLPSAMPIPLVFPDWRDKSQEIIGLVNGVCSAQRVSYTLVDCEYALVRLLKYAHRVGQDTAIFTDSITRYCQILRDRAMLQPLSMLMKLRHDWSIFTPDLRAIWTIVSDFIQDCIKHCQHANISRVSWSVDELLVGCIPAKGSCENGMWDFVVSQVNRGIDASSTQSITLLEGCDSPVFPGYSDGWSKGYIAWRTDRITK